MSKFSFVLLYVDNPPRSADFYAGLLGRQPVDSSPTFAMLPLSDEVMLGLWARHDVDPVASAPGGGEVAFTVADPATVERTRDDWKQRGVPIAQKPTAMNFGHTFVALDPDGHRLRVFAPAGAGGAA